MLRGRQGEASSCSSQVILRVCRVRYGWVERERNGGSGQANKNTPTTSASSSSRTFEAGETVHEQDTLQPRVALICWLPLPLPLPL